MIVFNDLVGKNSIINIQEFKNFVDKELNREKYKKYDLDINIRYLYPIDIHTEGKNIGDLDRFYKLNNLILSYRNRK